MDDLKDKQIKDKQIMATCYHCKLRVKPDDLMVHSLEHFIQHLKAEKPKEEGGGENREIEKPKKEGGE